MPIIEVNAATTLEEVTSQIEEALGYSVDHYTRICDLVLGQWLMVCRSIDVDALLGLADEIEADDVTYGVSMQYVLGDYARRIREALGVES